jgi:serine/threonine protein kinase/Tfp pilus assembly protein PilF
MNTPESREAAIFDGALQLPLDRRLTYIKAACGTDTELLQRVQKLLQAHEQGTGPLEEPAVPTPSGKPTIVLELTPTEKPGDKIGPYKILQQIGEGGCGVVYMAEQEVPVRRRVALKVIKLGMDTRQVIARFEAERQALALMDHPNIAKVFDAGSTETGRPYFVMELVRGIKITDYCDQNNLATKERLELFVHICRAIQHAHQKGIIHRDIKPSNVLVTLHDGVPVPKVIDFGIAKATDQKLTDKTLFTQFEQFIGTPAYMSPEQAEMTSLDIDTRSDIYSLGVLLYELLTSRTPFDAKELMAAGLDAMRRAIREKEPPRPSTRLSTMLVGDLTTIARQRHSEPPKLIHMLRGDLDWIVMKTLEKDRTRRYDTANGLAMDVQRYLSDEAVLARPPSQLYRFQKMVRRNKLACTATAAVAASLIIGLGLSTWLFFREKAARHIATREATRSQQVAQLLEDSLKGVGPSVALGHDTQLLREIMDRAVERVSKDLSEQPDVQAELCNTIGEVYRAIGETSKAEQMHREARSLQGKTASAGRGGDATVTLNDLALVLFDQGKFKEAESLQREVLELRRKAHGNEHADVAETLNNLGLVLRRENKLAEAEDVHRQALTIQRKIFGDEHLYNAASLNNLGLVLREEGKLPEAENSFREALAMLKKLKGEEDPAVALTLDNLGFVLREEGKLEEAETLARQAVAMQKKLLPAEHPAIATALNNLALVLARENKVAEAETLHREALAIRRKAWNNSHLEVASSLDNLGLLLRAAGKERLPEAESLATEALNMRRKLLGPENLAVAASLHNLALILRDQGKLAEAERSFRDALSMQRKLLGAEHPTVARMLHNTLDVLLREHKSGEAEALANEILVPSLESNPKAAGLLRARGAARARLGKSKDAISDFSKVADLEPNDRAAYDALSALFVQSAETDLYRSNCLRILRRFGNTTDPVIAQGAAKDCLLLALPGFDLAPVAKLAENTLNDKSGRATRAAQFTRALSDLRQQHHAAAAERLQTLANTPGDNASRDTQIFAVLALACHPGSDLAAARAALAKATDLAKSKFPTAESGDLGNDWMETLIAQVLLREATTLIEGKMAQK